MISYQITEFPDWYDLQRSEKIQKENEKDKNSEAVLTIIPCHGL